MSKKIAAWTLALALVMSSFGAFADESSQRAYNNLNDEGETIVLLGPSEYFQWFVPEEVYLEQTAKEESLLFNDNNEKTPYFADLSVGVQNVILKPTKTTDRMVTITCNGYGDLKLESDEEDTPEEEPVEEEKKEEKTPEPEEVPTITEWEIRKPAYLAKQNKDKTVIRYDADGFMKMDTEADVQYVSIPKTENTVILAVRSDYNTNPYTSELLLLVDEAVDADNSEKPSTVHETDEIKQPSVVYKPEVKNDVYVTRKTFAAENLAASTSFKVGTKLYYSLWGEPEVAGTYTTWVTYTAEITDIPLLVAPEPDDALEFEEYWEKNDVSDSEKVNQTTTEIIEQCTEKIMQTEGKEREKVEEIVAGLNDAVKEYWAAMFDEEKEAGEREEIIKHAQETIEFLANEAKDNNILPEEFTGAKNTLDAYWESYFEAVETKRNEKTDYSSFWNNLWEKNGLPEVKDGDNWCDVAKGEMVNQINKLTENISFKMNKAVEVDTISDAIFALGDIYTEYWSMVANNDPEADSKLAESLNTYKESNGLDETMFEEMNSFCKSCFENFNKAMEAKKEDEPEKTEDEPTTTDWSAYWNKYFADNPIVYTDKNDLNIKIDALTNPLVYEWIANLKETKTGEIYEEEIVSTVSSMKTKDKNYWKGVIIEGISKETMDSFVSFDSYLNTEGLDKEKLQEMKDYWDAFWSEYFTLYQSVLKAK